MRHPVYTQAHVAGSFVSSCSYVAVIQSLPVYSVDIALQRYLTQEHLDAEQRVQDEYNRKMNDANLQIRKALYSTTEAEIVEMFNEIDQDHSGMLDGA